MNAPTFLSRRIDNLGDLRAKLTGPPDAATCKECDLRLRCDAERAIFGEAGGSWRSTTH